MTESVKETRAEECAKRIRDYWMSRGHRVRVWINRLPFGPDGAIYEIKSDLKNGLPTGGKHGGLG